MPVKSVRLSDDLLGRIAGTGETLTDFLRAAAEQRLGVLASGRRGSSDRWAEDKAALLLVIGKGCRLTAKAAYELDWSKEKVERTAQRLELDGQITFERGIMEKRDV